MYEKKNCYLCAMCKADIHTAIKKLAFERRGFLTVYLEDGRILSVPLRDYPDIKRLNAKQRNSWTILDDQFFTFIERPEVFYSITDLMKL